MTAIACELHAFKPIFLLPPSAPRCNTLLPSQADVLSVLSMTHRYRNMLHGLMMIMVTVMMVMVTMDQ